MKMEISKRRLAFLSLAAALSVGITLATIHHLNRPDTLKIEEVLWVKKDGVFHAPGSSVSGAVIDRLHPDYIDFDEMSFSEPVLLLYDNLADMETSYSRTPLVLMPYDP